MKRTTIAGVGLLLATSAALANEPYFPRTEKALQRLDVNKDGKLTPDELAPLLLKRIALMDANGDKALTAEEIDKVLLDRVRKRRGRMMLLLDADKDGRITEAEVIRILDDMFDKADTNGDGAVDLAEIRAFKRGPWRKGLIDAKAN
jgi:Ca2+-binding EF-hand superfamily protein